MAAGFNTTRFVTLRPACILIETARPFKAATSTLASKSSVPLNAVVDRFSAVSSNAIGAPATLVNSLAGYSDTMTLSPVPA